MQDKQHTEARWVVVANEATAEIYSWDPVGHKLEKSFELANDSARRKQGDLVSDDAGRTFDSHGHGRHALSNKVSQKDAATVRFAADIVQRVVKAKQLGRCRDYAIIAAPRFLGHLRQALRSTTIEAPHTTISKDVVGHDVRRIEQLLLEP